MFPPGDTEQAVSRETQIEADILLFGFFFLMYKHTPSFPFHREPFPTVYRNVL